MPPGPLLLLAGPGTGKTYRLAQRVKDLVEEQGVTPEDITVLTFTREAARNMYTRISDPKRPEVHIPHDLRPKQISTMHSLGQRIIAENLDLAGLKEDFTILTSVDLRRILFGDSALMLGLDTGSGTQAADARQKGLSLGPGTDLARVCRAYSTILRACNAIDYDDQIVMACDILRQRDQVRRTYQRRATYLLVDEYQDINRPQFDMIRLLSEQNTNGLLVVGDDDQSIYSFRGGSPEYIRGFESHFLSAQVERVALCRRCPEAILRGALAIVEEFSPGRLVKPDPAFLASRNTKIVVHDLPSEEWEANLVARVAAETLPARDVLILVPHRGFTELLKRALRRRRISYSSPSVSEDGGFSAIGEVGAWARFPEDSLKLRFCIQRLIDAGAMNVPSERARRADRKAERQHVLRSIAGLWSKVIEKQISLYDALIAESKSKPGILRDLAIALSKTQDAVSSEPHKFLALVAEAFRPWSSTDALLGEISSYLEDLRDASLGSAASARVMTMQAAKGLEADVVFVLGLDEGVFPREGCTDENLAESSRLLFVSMTRAKEELHLVHVRKRSAKFTYRGGSFGLKPSPFLAAIPEDYKVVHYRKPSSG